MTPADAAIILGTAAAFDRRTVGKADAMAWSDALAGVRPQDAVEAVKHHYATSREFIYPADVIAIVKAVRAERIRAAGDISDRIPAHIEALDDPAASNAWMQEAKRRIGNGERLDDVAPRLQLVAADRQDIKAVTAKLARNKGAKNEPRESA